MKKLIFTTLIFLIGIIQVQSQNEFKNSEEHKTFKQNLMDEVSGKFSTPINSNTSFKQKPLESGIRDYGNDPSWNWIEQFGGSGTDYGRDIVTDDVGNVYITGSFSGEISITGNTYTSTGNRNAIVAKFDSSGILVWLKQFSASENNEIDSYGMCIDGSDNVYITGYYTGVVTLVSYF